MSKRSEAAQNIEQVAGIIAEHLAYGPLAFTRTDAQRVNDESGWGFDVRYDTHDYIGDGWTRVRGCQLSPTALATAWDLAAKSLEDL